jgi:hypothetical protein
MIYKLESFAGIQSDTMTREGLITAFAPYHFCIIGQEKQTDKVLVFVDGDVTQFLADTQAVKISDTLEIQEPYFYTNDFNGGNTKNKLRTWASVEIGCVTSLGFCMSCTDQDVLRVSMSTLRTILIDISGNIHQVTETEFNDVLLQMRTRGTQIVVGIR